MHWNWTICILQDSISGNRFRFKFRNWLFRECHVEAKFRWRNFVVGTENASDPIPGRHFLSNQHTEWTKKNYKIYYKRHRNGLWDDVQMMKDGFLISGRNQHTTRMSCGDSVFLYLIRLNKSKITSNWKPKKKKHPKMIPPPGTVAISIELILIIWLLYSRCHAC